MTGSLKKLEANDGGIALVVSPASRSAETPIVETRKQRQDSRQFSIPNDGWVNGPGRAFNVRPTPSLVRG